MMRIRGFAGAACAAMMAGAVWGGEAPYAFRERLETVHRTGMRDAALRPAADEFAFADGMKVDDADFADYLSVSMGVKASVGRDGAVVATVDDTLRDREYTVEVRKEGVEIRAADSRALHQAYYHLEDLMNLRRAPFLKIGTERRRMRFSPRMIHSGYGCDVFPDNYLKLIAHHGFDAIVFYIKDVDRTAAGPNQDVNGLIARARKVGLDTYLYSSVSCFAHPDDPEGRKDIEASFGRIAKAHPGAKGIVFVGESCQFPSKDPRVQPVRHQDKNHDDPRPLAGWFPCKDYPDWLRAVMDVLHRHSPDMEIVFWTYNWSRQDAKLCADLIPNFPDGVAIQGTLGNGAVTKHDNGLVCTCRDYTVSTPGFTDHYAAQAKAAKAGNRRFYTMANTAGLTWDYGVAPYLPCPFQWKKRWDGLVDPQYGIAGLMETHHFGWYPSFISELAKEAYTEGGMDFDEHIRRIAARDFGEANADKVVEAWRKWSRTEVDYVANNENQYGPFRIGPAFPYNFGGRKIAHAEFPQDKRAYHTMRWMAILNFPFDLEQAHEQNIAFVEIDDDYRLKQLELFERMRADWADGVKALKEAAQTLEGVRRTRAEEMIGVGEWHQRSVETAINLNRGYLAFKRGDREGMLKYARAEYANALEALKLVERDSRLGWEPSMEYAAGPEQIRWKLKRMEALYGEASCMGCVCDRTDAGAELPPLITNCETRVNAALKGKKAFYYCDDVIWLFRDLTRQRPKSLFDNPFLAILKEAHDRYGMKAQLNCFYRLDFFYGTDEFTLAEMTDAYRAEWQANKDWLKLGLHSLQEFPDYPFINADYRDMKTVVDRISGEIGRFAGPGVFAKGAVVHWGMISKDACRALSDSGIVMLCSHCGPRHAYNGDPSVLPYGHAMRLEQNRKPETCLYRRLSEDKAISSSIGGYNNLTYGQAREIYGNFKYVYDRETGIGMKELEDFQPLAAGINLYTLETLIPAAQPYLGNAFFVWGNHEQYFHRDYLAYQPEYAAKILALAKLLKENGYEHFFLEELAAGK